MFRSNKSMRAIAALLATAGLTLSACGTTDDDPESSDGGDGPNCDAKIAFMGALTGPAAGLGIAAVNGAELAILQYNEEHADCDVEFVKSDSQSDPKQAPGVAKSLIDDEGDVGHGRPALLRRVGGGRPAVRRGRAADDHGIRNQAVAFGAGLDNVPPDPGQ